MRRHKVPVMVMVVVTAGTFTLVLLSPPRPSAPAHAVLLPQEPPAPSRRHVPHCQAMFTVNKSSPDTWWDSDVPYEELASRLPLLLGDIKSEGSPENKSAPLFLGTRLELMGGTVPYIPCLVQEYRVKDAGRCVAVRAAKGASTWIAFVGDSNQRQKIHSFLDFLPPDLAYSFYLGDKQVSLQVFTDAVSHHKKRPPVFEIVGRPLPPPPTSTSTPPPPLYPTRSLGHRYSISPSGGDEVLRYKNDSNGGQKESHASQVTLLEGKSQPQEPYVFRVTVLWYPGTNDAVQSSSFSRKLVVARLQEWLNMNTLPAAVVVGFGTWMLADRKSTDELWPFTELEEAALALEDTLTRLAVRTSLLYWVQSRYRWFNTGGHGPSADMKEGKFKYWDTFMYLNQFHDSLPLLDTWLWRIMKKTGAWLWDSTLPFNLANLRECQQLSKAKMYYHPLYTGRWWNCFDVHHASYETNSVEIQMLLNLLCNAHLNTPAHYCCST
ncbi:uncharacterized protein LOC135114984 isoform X1 [Scylla paramamosain]|uniref:uncharacterized protein LOC135114984 isoform X1 n=1 Tax=Scylla paramamosain TaxID=85552 RepID=UPI003083DED7